MEKKKQERKKAASPADDSGYDKAKEVEPLVKQFDLFRSKKDNAANELVKFCLYQGFSTKWSNAAAIANVPVALIEIIKGETNLEKKARAIMALIRAVFSHKQNQSVAAGYGAIPLLMNLAQVSNDDGCVRMTSQGVPIYNSDCVRNRALVALRILVIDNPENQSEAVKEGVIPLLMEYAAKDPDHEMEMIDTVEDILEILSNATKTKTASRRKVSRKGKKTPKNE